MAYYPATSFVPQFFTDAGVPLSGGKLYAYLADSTTPTPMYIDDIGTSAGTSITLNARGEPQVSGNTVMIWLDTDIEYKFALADASLISKWTIDDISQAGATLRRELANTSSTSLGDALIGMKRTLTSAIATTLHAWYEGTIVNLVTDFGVVLDGVTNNAVALQNAFSSGAKHFYLPVGQCNMGSVINITSAVTICGAGWGTSGTTGSIFAATSATQDMFNVTSTGSVTFRDVELSSTVPKTAGIAIKVDPGAAAQTNWVKIENVRFQFQFQSIDFVRAAYFHIAHVSCENNSANGTQIKVRNTTTPDSGDSTIFDLTIAGGTGVTGLRYESGGGLRVMCSKFLAIAVGIDYTGSASAGTGIFSVDSTCSFDQITGQSISLTTADATGQLTDIIIDGIFTGNPSNYHVYVAPVVGASLGRGVIRGRYLRTDGGTSIQLVGGGNWTVIPDGINQASGVGISIGSAVTNSTVIAHQLEGCTVSNSSATTSVVRHLSGASVGLTVDGNMGIGTSSFGTGMTNGLATVNTTAPSTSPTGVGQTYQEGGALKYRSPAGTITTMGAA
jgi:hypothetical protein